MLYLYPYRTGSRGVKALATALGARVIRLHGSRFHKTPTRRVINWGSATCPEAYEALNPSARTSIARNKLETFRRLSSPVDGLTLPRVPLWTESRQEASQWLSQTSVVCRHSLTGQGGSGIEITEQGQTELPEAPLYVKYIKKDSEYRVHVFKTDLQGPYEVVHVQRKIKDPTKEVTNWKVRSHINGFIFSKSNNQGQNYLDVCPEDVKNQALSAVSCLGLDFAAVDVLWNNHLGQAFVVELNTAPGLENSTINIYREALLKYYS